jgi:membrane associated rhomboid family serine protease
MSDFRSYTPDSFPPIVKNLIIINVMVFLAQLTFESNATFNLENMFALHDLHSVFFKPHQLITHLFMHGGISHLFFNMFALWMFGRTLENFWGSKRFLMFYISCGLGAAILHLLFLYIEMEPIMNIFYSLPLDQQASIVDSPTFKINIPTLGASGAVFGCLAAFAYLFPNTMFYVYFLLPIKAKWFVLIYGAIELGLAIRNSAGDNIAHFAHLGGALTGFIIVLIWNKTGRKRFY